MIFADHAELVLQLGRIVPIVGECGFHVPTNDPILSHGDVGEVADDMHLIFFPCVVHAVELEFVQHFPAADLLLYLDWLDGHC